MVEGLTQDLMTLATETLSSGEDEDDGLSSGIIALIVVLVTLLVLVLVVAIVAYLVYKKKRKVKYDVHNTQRSYGGTDYIADNTASCIFIQQIQSSSHVEEMISTEPELLKETSPIEKSANDDDDIIKVNLNAVATGDDDKDTSL